MPHREQTATIITKTAGSLTTGTGMIQILGQYQHEIITICTIVGALITVISYLTMRHYQKQRHEFEKNRDMREQELHNLRVKALQAK